MIHLLSDYSTKNQTTHLYESLGMPAGPIFTLTITTNSNSSQNDVFFLVIASFTKGSNVLIQHQDMSMSHEM
jgi:hypothetical protein